MKKNKSQFKGGFSENFSFLLIPLYVIILSFFLILISITTKVGQNSSKLNIIQKEFKDVGKHIQLYGRKTEGNFLKPDATISRIKKIMTDNFKINVINSEDGYNKLLFIVNISEIFKDNISIEEKMNIFLRDISEIFREEKDFRLKILFNDLFFKKNPKNHINIVSKLNDLLFDFLPPSQFSIIITDDSLFKENQAAFLIERHY